MKRSAALEALSRDHHLALVVAQRLRRAGPKTASEARAGFLAYWSTHGRRHFRLEEEVLLPAYAAYGDAHHPLVLTALGDHVALRALATRVAADITASGGTLQRLGERLADHVRLEERQLFPLIEDAMPARELAALAEALERAEAEE